jgi:hypothetical protein
MTHDDASCFSEPPIVALVVGYFLTVGIVISYIPQVSPPTQNNFSPFF